VVEHGDTTDPKIRLRSDAELAAQARGLEALCDALARAGVPHLLSGGTLLGAARDGDFIRWDWDVEVSVRTEDVVDRFDELVAVLEQDGFTLHERDDADDNRKLVLVRDGATFELQAYRLEGALRTRRHYRTAQRFFDGAATIELRGRTYPCMGPVDEYLTDRYGDWRTPLRTSDKRAYLDPGYFRTPAPRRRWWAPLRATLGQARRRVLRRLATGR
jgi:lipopolysaccharide cholinephosphotransferase